MEYIVLKNGNKIGVIPTKNKSDYVTMTFDDHPCPIAHEYYRKIYCEHSTFSYEGLQMIYSCSNFGVDDCKLKRMGLIKDGMVNMSFEERIKKLNKMIAESKSIVFFGGAGVSTESGIPDFRSADGLYNNRGIEFEKYLPEYLLSRKCLYDEPEVFYEFYRQKLDCRGIEPNITHKKLAELEKIGKLSAVITQNIDGLHQKAGSKNVFAIHGTTEYNYCMKCAKSYPSDYIFTNEDKIPTCPECGGKIRPHVVLYGENLPGFAWDASANALTEADLLIIGGTSLSVYPAANLIDYYYGKNIVIINKSETGKDKRADLRFTESLGEVFSRIEI